MKTINSKANAVERGKDWLCSSEAASLLFSVGQEANGANRRSPHNNQRSWQWRGTSRCIKDLAQRCFQHTLLIVTNTHAHKNPLKPYRKPHYDQCMYSKPEIKQIKSENMKSLSHLLDDKQKHTCLNVITLIHAFH